MSKPSSIRKKIHQLSHSVKGRIKIVPSSDHSDTEETHHLPPPPPPPPPSPTNISTSESEKRGQSIEKLETPEKPEKPSDTKMISNFGEYIYLPSFFLVSSFLVLYNIQLKLCLLHFPFSHYFPFVLIFYL